MRDAPQVGLQRSRCCLGRWWVMQALGLVALVGSLAVGQEPGPSDLPGLDGAAQSFDAPAATVEFSARLQSSASQRPELVIEAQVQPGWHVYSITQAPGGPIPTKVTLAPSPDYQLGGPFTPDTAPERHAEPLFDNLVVETHEGRVTWRAPLVPAAGRELKELIVRGQVTAQTCSDSSCNPPEKFPFVARWTGPVPAASAVVAAPTEAAGSPTAAAPTRSATSSSAAGGVPTAGVPAAGVPAAIGNYQKAGTHTRIFGEVSQAVAAPGQRVWVTLTAQPSGGFHVYALAEGEGDGVSKPTIIAWQELAGWSAGPPMASSEPIAAPSTLAGGAITRYHQGEVAWRVPIDIPPQAAEGSYSLAGLIGYQACTDRSCEPPLAARFQITVDIRRDAPAAGDSKPLEFFPARYADASRLAAGTAPTAEPNVTEAEPASAVKKLFGQLEPQDLSARPRSLAGVFLAALLGGFLLNFMPCVLPVVGLKILAFVQQSGQHRREAFLLNLWYALGVVAVFLVLATLATALNLSWGQQFTSTWFNITLAALVFAMGLSFLGVWEIPIPGLAGTGKANQLAAREGFAGAFFKGALSTVLATPCSGPFLGPVFGFTLTVPPYITYAVFTAIGLGMASPYLLIGAFPRLIRFLPKPGAWMDTFKNVMGFVMLGTVVYLFSFLDRDYLVAAFGLLVGVWAACWWIGRTSVLAAPAVRLGAWLGSATLVAAVGWVSFYLFVPRPELLPWQEFSAARLSQLTGEGQTVLVDFTADWCLTCQANEALALNTQEVHHWVEENGVVTLKADWTEPSDEIQEMLALLGSNSIPVYAIFPADRPRQPLVLRDVITQRQLLGALRSAGPSRAESTATASLGR